MDARAGLLALSLSAIATLGCRAGADADAGASGETGAGDSSGEGVGDGPGEGDGDGPGDGDGELPGWDCDPIRWLAGTSPEAAPSLSGSGSGLAVVGERVFVCREGGPLELWSAADDQLSLLATVELARPGCKWIAVADDGQRVAVSDPGDFAGPGFVQIIEWSGDALVAGPSVSGGNFEGLGFSTAGTELLVAARAEGVRVFAIGEQLEPLPGYADDSSDAHALGSFDGQLWVAEGVHGLRRFEWSGPELAPIPASSVALAGVTQDLAFTRLDGADYLLAANLGGVVAVALADETITSTGPTRGVSLRLATLGADRVVLADWDALRVLDFGQPSVPRVVAHQGEFGGPTEGLFGVRDVALLEAGAGNERLLSSGLRGLELWAYASDCEAPALAAERRRLHFTPDRDDRVLNLLNEGTADLEILAITSDDPSVRAKPNAFVIPPGGIKAVEVAIEHGQPRVSSLAIHAVQPDTLPAELELCADCPGMKVGSELPPMTHVDIHGELWSRERMAGRVIMLAYFATWCSTCANDMPLFETELWQPYADAGGLVLGLSNQPPEQVVAWARARGLSFPILLQQDSYERWASPEEFPPYSLDVVIDRAGVTQALGHGGDIADWVALFEALL